MMRMRTRAWRPRALAPPALCAALLLAGCGGDDRSAQRTPGAHTGEGTPTPTAAPARPASANEVRIIRAWANAVRARDVERASRLFSVPAIVANGTPPQELADRDDVRLFNRALTCGARLKHAERDGAYVNATFELTELAGESSRCGAAVGRPARTAFLIQRGKIKAWLRLPDEEPPEGPVS